MPGIASATGLMAARVRPVYRAKQKRVELSGSAKPAPFAIRPFSGLFNPYPYGCSVLCNHPADCEAREVVRKAKDLWATEGKALLLPEEMEMIRASLLAGATDVTAGNVSGGAEAANDATDVPEELFRKYTETDSRPLTPTPTLASGTAGLTNRPAQDHPIPVTSNPRERTTLVLDLRAGPHGHAIENETFSWHALTLEPPPTPRRTEVSVARPIARHQTHPVPNPTEPVPEANEEPARTSDEDSVIVVQRRGKKRLRKRKCRRGSAYGQQTEVRDPSEPTETQVSQVGDASPRDSARTCENEPPGGPSSSSPKRTIRQSGQQTMPPSFIPAEILKHLCRELDRDKVEAEFSVKKRIAFEEALRVKGEGHQGLRVSRQAPVTELAGNAPRVFTRQAARFEILDSESLHGLSPVEYLSRHVSVSPGRKLIFGRAFARFNDDTVQGPRRILPADVPDALEEVVGKPLTDEQLDYLRSLVGQLTEPLNFRTWCGLCAACERLLCPLPCRQADPPGWLERTDFEALDRRIRSTLVDPRLVKLLTEIRDK